MTGAKMVLVTGIVGEISAQVAGGGTGGLVEIYKVGGIVAVLLVLLAVVYLDGRKQREQIAALYREAVEATVAHAKATQTYADAARTQTAGIFEMSRTVKTVVRDCAQRRGLTVETPEAPDMQRPL